MKKVQKTRDNDQIKILEEKIIDLDSKWKRALADYQNLQKRTENDKSRFAKLANATLVEKLLSIIDDLERAAAHVKDEGINMIVKQFSILLEEEGVEEIIAHGQVFNPETMECVEITAGEKEMVVKVAQKGYMLNDFILRPAKVEVGSGIKENNNKN